MVTPSRLVSLLAALASTAHSLALGPTSDLSPIHHVINLTSTAPAANASSSLSSSPNGLTRCHTNKTPFVRRKPRFSDCGAAISLLPSSHAFGTFRTGGSDEEFRLPVTQTLSTCSVEVAIKSGFDGDTSTWFDLGTAATHLNMVCVNRFTFPIKIGGWTTAGTLERIVVTLRFSGLENVVEYV